MSQRDTVTRSMIEDGSFRIIATTIGPAAQAIAVAQGANDEQGQRLAQLLMAAILVRETSAPGKRVQVNMETGALGSLIAESRPDGACRGFINPRAETDEPTQTLFQVAYHRKDGSLHQSTVAVEPDVGVAEALMHYLQASEQIVATVELSAEGPPASLRGAGLAVQLLPEASAEIMQTMTERLEGREQLSATAGTDDIVRGLVGDLPVTPLATSELRFECTCSRDRVVATIAGLARSEIAELVAKGEGVEVNCDGCNHTYRIELAELTAMMPPDEV